MMANDVPLDSLVMFASAARHLNFTLVAEEFGTTQPAVSQRIAVLEKHLGIALFKRAHRGVRVTAEGAALYESVREPLSAIQLAVERVRTRQLREVLTVATDFAFANFWLVPRLAAFQELRPELDVRIVTSQNGFDIRGEPVDLAISFGSGQWPGCDAQRILPEVVVPVASPALLARHAPTTAAHVIAMPLLHLDGSEPGRWMTWQGWADAQGARQGMSAQKESGQNTAAQKASGQKASAQKASQQKASAQQASEQQVSAQKASQQKASQRQASEQQASQQKASEQISTTQARTGQSLTLGNYPLVIQAAVAGRGVALGWRPLVDDLLRDGQLAALPWGELATARGYYLVAPHGRAPGPALAALRAWIVDQCAAVERGGQEGNAPAGI
jgi:LysR family glycine cleavage system transcriptional activator